jgi:hypothetical protein
MVTLSTTIPCRCRVLLFYKTLLMMIYLPVNRQIKIAGIKRAVALKDFIVFLNAAFFELQFIPDTSSQAYVVGVSFNGSIPGA